ncbi:MAG: UdgX family uracil-DNA binding protein [Pirellulaceae bacterium]
MVRSQDGPSAADFVPSSRELDDLRAAASSCRGCELYESATQTVFGAGSPRARVMLIGEQPGDREDVAGEPFVGPAGQLLREILAECSITARDCYMTNAVKHFRWQPQSRGKRRLHAKPVVRHIRACRPWLEAEIEAVNPELVVCLGATAGQSCFGSGFRLLDVRGRVLEGPWGHPTLCTYHPSAVLRAPDTATRTEMRRTLRKDLGEVAARLAS